MLIWTCMKKMFRVSCWSWGNAICICGITSYPQLKTFYGPSFPSGTAPSSPIKSRVYSAWRTQIEFSDACDWALVTNEPLKSSQTSYERRPFATPNSISHFARCHEPSRVAGITTSFDAVRRALGAREHIASDYENFIWATLAKLIFHALNDSQARRVSFSARPLGRNYFYSCRRLILWLS